MLVFILTVGVFGIINTEMGVVGILPLIATTFNVSVPQAGWTVKMCIRDRVKGEDTQLKVAVDELLKEIDSQKK